MLGKFSITKNTVQNEVLNHLYNKFFLTLHHALNKISEILFKKIEIHYLLMAFLLGRALILNELSPFAIPFFATMYHLKKDKTMFISLSILLGSYFAEVNKAETLFWGMLLFFLSQKWLERQRKTDLSYTPFLVTFSILIPEIIQNIYLQSDQIYPWLLSGIDAMLGFVLTLIFVQALPILVYRKEQFSLSQEEIIALIIVLASVMTGSIGWQINGFSIEHIFSRYFILLFALVGGGAIGSSVGVVIGLILSLANPNAVYQISLLAFSGLLAGLLKQAKKLGVAAGLLLGTTILSLYIGNQGEIWNSFNESGIALLLFLLTPKSLIKDMAKFIPGTNEYDEHYQEHIARMKKITSNKINQFSNMFSQLANSFKEISSTPLLEQNEQIDHFMNQVSEEHCKTCWKKNKCWEEDFFKTYQLMTELMTAIENNGDMQRRYIPKDWMNHCVKFDEVTFQLVDIYKSYGDHLYWKAQLEESRLLVANQLFGVSKVMKDLAVEIQKEGNELGIQEQQIEQSLESLGLSIRKVNIIRLDEGNVEIEINQLGCKGVDQCSKVVAPLLSEVIGENIIVKEKICNYGEDGTCKMCLKSAKTFEVEAGYAGAAKGGKWLSGDSFSSMELNNGRYIVALSDGMGNGERAQKESKATLELLQQLLQSGIDETISIKTINSVLLLRSQEEIFSTIDLAIIDLFNGFTKFLKVGSTPSFIKRGEELIVVSANNLPIGIIQDIDIDSKEFDLMSGDLLIMITDGIYDTPKYTSNKEIWVKRIIQEIKTDDPQEFADLFLEKVVRHNQGEIKDDMTIVVSKIQEYRPEWTTFKVPGISKIEREKIIN